MDERRRAHNSTLRQSRAPMRKVSDRHAAEWARAYGSDARVEWVKRQPCLVPGCQRGPCDNAHLGNGGIGRKEDADRIIPLCGFHHRELHDTGRHVFEKVHELDLLHAALLLDERWRLRTDDGSEPLEDEAER